MKTKVAIVMLMLVMFSAQSLAAWGRGAKPNRQNIMTVLAKKLDLTQDQIDKFRAGEQEQKKAMEAGRQKIKELGDKLKNELAKDSPDKNKVHDLISQIGAQTTQLQVVRTDSLLKLKALLTPEQKEKFRKLLDRKGGRMPLGLGGNRH